MSQCAVLFLDEPTSGLDSFTAHEVITVVRTLVSLAEALGHHVTGMHDWQA